MARGSRTNLATLIADVGDKSPVDRAMVKVLSRGYRTPDLKSRSGRDKAKERVVSTKEMGELICDYIRMPDAT